MLPKYSKTFMTSPGVWAGMLRAEPPTGLKELFSGLFDTLLATWSKEIAWYITYTVFWITSISPTNLGATSARSRIRQPSWPQLSASPWTVWSRVWRPRCAIGWTWRLI